MTSRLRTVAAVSLLVGSFVVAGCGGNDEQGRTTTTTTTVTGTTGAPSTSAGQGGVGGPGAGSDLPEATGAPAVAGIGATSGAGVIRPFSATSPWNTPVTGLPTDARSRFWVQEVKIRRGVRESGDVVTARRRVVNDPLFINTRRWTTPVVDEDGGVATRVVCRQLPPYCGDGNRVTSLLIPPSQDPLPQYDGWFTVLDRSQGVAYDLWRARRGEGDNSEVISYQFMRKWDLNGPGYQVPDKVSARGSGLPLFAGLILPEEIEAGRIDHALAISLPGPAQRKYMQPASSTDGVGAVNSMPEGARLRLKSNVRLTFAACPRTKAQRSTSSDETTTDKAKSPRCYTARTNRRAARAIFTALRRYGAILVDRSRVPTLYAELTPQWQTVLKDQNGRLLSDNGRPLSSSVRRFPDQGTPLLRGSEVQQLRIDDFEVVRTGAQLRNFPDLKTVQANAARGAVVQGQTFSGGVP